MSDDERPEVVFAKFRDGVSKQISPEDVQTHFDLGVAYAEMGLHADAISEFEIVTRVAAPENALRERAGDAIRECKVALGEPPPDIVA